MPKMGMGMATFYACKIPIGRLDANAIQQNVVTSNLFFAGKVLYEPGTRQRA